MDGTDKETRSDSSRDDGVGGEPVRTGSRVGRVLSRIASTPTSDPGPPPDGGYDAWMAVLSAHFIFMDTWGFVNSFGVFQTYYVRQLGRPPSDISWIGSFQVFLLFFVGAFSGRFTDAGYFRHLFLCGSFLVLLGIFATSWCTQYWQIFLAHGVCVGLGFGLVFCPSLATLSTYFDRRRALAIGIAAVGSASGGLVFPSTVRQLLPRVGFPWAMRTLGFIQLATLSVGLVFLKPRIPPRRASKLVDLSAFKELEYTFYTAGGFFVSPGDLCFSEYGKEERKERKRNRSLRPLLVLHGRILRLLLPGLVQPRRARLFVHGLAEPAPGPQRHRLRGTPRAQLPRRQGRDHHRLHAHGAPLGAPDVLLDRRRVRDGPLRVDRLLRCRRQRHPVPLPRGHQRPDDGPEQARLAHRHGLHRRLLRRAHRQPHRRRHRLGHWGSVPRRPGLCWELSDARRFLPGAGPRGQDEEDRTRVVCQGLKSLALQPHQSGQGPGHELTRIHVQISEAVKL
ncbi:major facilitator superfamily transporter [Colletotrichum graminicola]|nr:major facilitator superfamily transporter [Colletotrichum graminicola]